MSDHNRLASKAANEPSSGLVCRSWSSGAAPTGQLILLLRQNLRGVVRSFEIDFLGILIVQAESVIRQPGNEHGKNPVQRPPHGVDSTTNELIRGERTAESEPRLLHRGFEIGMAFGSRSLGVYTAIA